jgi:hypothetical protein
MRNESDIASRVVREPLTNCPLHKALMNVGYEIYRKNYYEKGTGKCTGKVVDYYAPAYDPNKILPGCVRDWSSEPHYVIGRGGNAYPAEFIDMYPYSYGR